VLNYELRNEHPLGNGGIAPPSLISALDGDKCIFMVTYNLLKDYEFLVLTVWTDGRLNNSVMCRVVCVTKVTGSSSDDWIY
jgi:hypothetical protein